MVAKVYTSVRQLLDSMLAKKDASQRVVLVDFPIAGQKSIGFLTRTLVDSHTGEELAAVLLPNAINPTSAFLQLLPLSRVTMTDLTMEQAMSMLMTGGAVAPESLAFSHPDALRDAAAQCLLSLVRGGMVDSDLFGNFAFVGDLAEVDMLKLRPD